MATIVLSAVGAAVGSAVGGSVLGLSSVVIGRVVGATLGQVLDQRIMGGGSAPVETGKVDRLRLTGASEGAPVRRVFGRTRTAGQVIWASRFLEQKSVSGGGKRSGPQVTSYSYSVSLAVAVAEGEIARIGRIWADGVELVRSDLNLRVYRGTEDQLPDPRMETVEGAGNVPAYRGLAYVVIEDLPLGRFGNRVPQLSFEVVRPVPSPDPAEVPLGDILQGVALIPGTGEYALATTPVRYGGGPAGGAAANANSPSGQTDFATSLEVLKEELPSCGATLLTACWFGDDLRCGTCTIQPKVEQAQQDGAPIAWTVSGQSRGQVQQVPRLDGRAVYGGTPADQSVIEAITALKADGKRVTFYPFILMDQLEDNVLPDPWTGTAGQAAFPWRGRITTSLAPGVAGSPDQTAAAEVEIAAFFGQAMPGDFTVVPGSAQSAGPGTLPFAGSGGGSGATIAYNGPTEWSYRRFVLHYAHLCAAAGGVDAFCIGSEMRGLTQIRGAGGSFPAVQALRALAADVRTILGPGVEITYAADWSEYFGYQPQDGSGDVLFHLDPLWADPEIDFVGIDNYMPLSDWRDGEDHADASWGAIYELAYLKANIEGGEGYDWYYPSPEARDAQRRLPIEDGAHGEPWVFRYKDIRNWWLNPHHERIGGVRQPAATAWVPQSKPVRFVEYGCAAIDKGTNQPNKFLDPKSSESSLPAYSSGLRDDFIQQQYLRAMNAYWHDTANNPVSDIYGGTMIEMSGSHVWAWDTRPYPWFPSNTALWSDGDNYERGHWLNGRASSQALAALVREICAKSGVSEVDASRLHGIVRGYALEDVTSARAALQPLMLAYGFDAIERDGKLVFQTRGGAGGGAVVVPSELAVIPESSGLETIRLPEAETAGRVRLSFIEADANYEIRASEAIFSDEESRAVSASEVPLVLTPSEGQAIAQRWLAESRVARDQARFALPPSRLALGAGEIVALETAEGSGLYRLDRLEQGEAQLVEAVRMEPNIYSPADVVAERAALTPFVAPVPVFPLFLDLPLVTGTEVEHAPHLAVTATPWPGSVSVFSAPQDSGYALNTTLNGSAVIGVTETPLFRAPAGLWDRGPDLRVRVYGGTLASAAPDTVLNGANLMAIGNGSSSVWEVFQFAEAVLVAPDTYDVRTRLRGQLGTDGVMPDAWPAGSYVVALDGTPKQIALQANERGLARHYRIGPAGRAYDDPSYVYLLEAFQGIGLRPYAPCHLRAARDASGGLDVSWIRRTRIDGDSWDSFEVPLGEASLQFQVRVLDGNGALLRETLVSQESWHYGATEQAADGVAVPFTIEVAQVSDRFGPGLFDRITIGA